MNEELFHLRQAITDASVEASRPSTIFKPNVLRTSGGRWQARHHDVIGEGTTPDSACRAFDRAWSEETGKFGVQDG